MYGGVNGVKGILEGRLCELGGIVRNAMDLAALAATPAAALGSCRFKLDGGRGTRRASACLRYSGPMRYRILCTSGATTPWTRWRSSPPGLRRGESADITVVGAPKTIDNDLMETDHCPGFGSAAKFIAATCAQLERDLAVYDTFGVTVVEIMGRDAGWLTAAASPGILKRRQRPGPDLPVRAAVFCGSVSAGGGGAQRGEEKSAGGGERRGERRDGEVSL